MPGDRYLLCSDGLSGVVSDETLRDTLEAVADPDAAARELIELAIAGGGPDNITCVVADVVDTATTRLPLPSVPLLAGATTWVLGSIVIGVLVSVSLGGLVAFCVASELAAIPLILIVRARTRPVGQPGARGLSRSFPSGRRDG